MLALLLVAAVGVRGSFWGWLIGRDGRYVAPTPSATTVPRRSVAPALLLPPRTVGVAAADGLYVGPCVDGLAAQHFEMTAAGEMRSVSKGACVACRVNVADGACSMLSLEPCGGTSPIVFTPNRTTGLITAIRGTGVRVCMDVCNDPHRVPSCIKRRTHHMEVLLYSCHSAMNQRWRVDARKGLVKSLMLGWKQSRCLTAMAREPIVEPTAAPTSPTAAPVADKPWQPWNFGDALPLRRCHYNHEPIVSKRYAVMTMLIEPAQCNNTKGTMPFAEGIEVLGYSLQKYVKRDDYATLVLLHGQNFPPGAPATLACAARLARAGWTSCIAAPIDPPVPSKFKRFSQLFIKFVAFNMVEFEKVVLLDGDVAVVAPGFGDIFETPLSVDAPLAATLDFMSSRGGFQSTFNMGVALVKTDAGLFNRILKTLMDGRLRYNHAMSEQGFLAAFLAPTQWIRLPWTMGANLNMLQAPAGEREAKWNAAVAANNLSAVHYTACKPFCGTSVIEGCPHARCMNWGYKSEVERWRALRAEMLTARSPGERLREYKTS